jgi:hypothetical protein
MFVIAGAVTNTTRGPGTLVVLVAGWTAILAE